MVSTYNIFMDDGTPVILVSISAAEAMQIAIDRHRGRKVAQCWTGDLLRNPKRGFTDFDVPSHEALPKKEPFNRRSQEDRIKDGACQLLTIPKFWQSRQRLWRLNPYENAPPLPLHGYPDYDRLFKIRTRTQNQNLGPLLDNSIGS